LLVDQGKWDEGLRQFELAIEIADDIGMSELAKIARESLVMVYLYRKNLTSAREMVEAARKFDVPLGNHRTSAMLGLVALRQGDRNAARDAFTTATNEAAQLIALTADRYAALDIKGLSLCGLALCGDLVQIAAAKDAYKAARAVTSDAGIVGTVLQYFDALAEADIDDILAEVRPVAAGISQTPQQ
jgi:tetratricopeptide (TPR) repeat protein